MSMTFAQMIEEVQIAAGDKSAGFRLVIQRTLNRQRRLIFKHHPGRAQEVEYALSLIAGQSSYNLPSTVGRIEKAFRASGEEIDLWDEALFRGEYQTMSLETGMVEILRQYGRDASRSLTVKPWRIPSENQTINLLTYSQPAWLVEETAQSEMDDAFDSVVITAAIRHCHLLNGDDMVSVSDRIARDELAGFMASDDTTDGKQRNWSFKTDPVVQMMRDE
jgi:hypothetical protein